MLHVWEAFTRDLAENRKGHRDEKDELAVAKFVKNDINRVTDTYINMLLYIILPDVGGAKWLSPRTIFMD